MDIAVLKKMIEDDNNCETERSWTMSGFMLQHENDYLVVKRVDSSNKWIDADEMGKM
ncbi:MAG: hypothetical protein WDA00_03300 [Eubacteriales bacterium]